MLQHSFNNVYICIELLNANLYKTQILNKKTLGSLNLSIVTLTMLLLTLGVTSSYSQGFEEDQSTSVQIYKSSLNSYSIINDTAFIKPFFDTTYTISGSSTSMNTSQSIINSTIINDFMLSPTVGYIMQYTNNTSIGNNSSTILPSLPNPFVDIDTISSKIHQEISQAINNAVDIGNYKVDIRCTFGENIEDWDCEVFSLPI